MPDLWAVPSVWEKALVSEELEKKKGTHTDIMDSKHWWSPEQNCVMSLLAGRLRYFPLHHRFVENSSSRDMNDFVFLGVLVYYSPSEINCQCTIQVLEHTKYLALPLALYFAWCSYNIVILTQDGELSISIFKKILF